VDKRTDEKRNAPQMIKSTKPTNYIADHLSASQQQELLDNATLTFHKRNATIDAAAHPCCYYILLEGVCYYGHSEGAIYRFSFPGSFLHVHESHNVRITTATPVVLAQVSKDDFKRIIGDTDFDVMLYRLHLKDLQTMLFLSKLSIPQQIKWLYAHKYPQHLPVTLLARFIGVSPQFFHRIRKQQGESQYN
jgi:hypothetical protein